MIMACMGSQGAPFTTMQKKTAIDKHAECLIFSPVDSRMPQRSAANVAVFVQRPIQISFQVLHDR